jgi:hypothetical protein
MSLAPGTRLGAYEVVALIGAGGMGEVYRARDTKLQRDVAIKVLPEALAYDPERLARFEREARTLASLNHPNIAQLHGVEESDGIKALIMELAKGPTLADRIAQGSHRGHIGERLPEFRIAERRNACFPPACQRNVSGHLYAVTAWRAESSPGRKRATIRGRRSVLAQWPVVGVRVG